MEMRYIFNLANIAFLYQIIYKKTLIIKILSFF